MNQYVRGVLAWGLVTFLAASEVRVEVAQARQALDSRDPAARAAALGTLAQAWPTVLADLTEARRALADPDPRVVGAAVGFLAKARDDSALPELVAHLDGDGDGVVRRALISLVGQDAGPPEAWREIVAQRAMRLEAPAAALRAALDRHDAEAAREAIHSLLFLKDQPAVVGQLLVEAAEVGDPAVARIALSGLAAIGGPVAACRAIQLPNGADAVTQPAWKPPVKETAAVHVAPGPAPTPWDPVGFLVGLALTAILGGIGWTLWQVKPIQHATRRIVRSAQVQVTARVVDPARKASRRMTVAIARPASRRIKALTARIRKPPAPP